MADADEAELDKARRRGVEQRQEAVDGMLRSNQYEDALKEALKNPPLGTSSQEIKDDNAAMVISTIVAVSRALGEKGLEPLVKSLSADAVDTLSKYLYRGLSQPSGDSSLLLKTTNLVSRIRGLGTIARTIADRRTL